MKRKMCVEWNNVANKTQVYTRFSFHYDLFVRELWHFGKPTWHAFTLVQVHRAVRYTPSLA